MANENPFAPYLTQADELQTRGKDQLMQSMGTPQMDSGQVLSVLLGSALPAVFGGILGGSTGLQAGAAGGATGAEFGIKQAQADAERKQKLAQVLATQDLEQAQQLRTQAFTGQRDAEKERAADERQQVTVAQQDKLASERSAQSEARLGAMLGQSERNAAARDERFNKTFEKGQITAKETELTNVTNRWDRKAKPLEAKAQAIQELDGMLAQGNNISTGMIKRAAVKLSEGAGSKVSDKDIAGLVPDTVAGQAVGFSNYLSGSTDQTLTPDQIGAFKSYIDAQKALLKKQRDATKSEFYNTYDKGDTHNDKAVIKSHIDDLGSSLDLVIGGAQSGNAGLQFGEDAIQKKMEEIKARMKNGR